MIINITDSLGTKIVNTTMLDSFYYNTTYTEIVTYTYSIWENDIHNNINISTGHHFDIFSIGAPIIKDNSGI